MQRWLSRYFGSCATHREEAGVIQFEVGRSRECTRVAPTSP